MPPRRDAFVGRGALLARIEVALRDGERLVTLLGTGGVGKTRVAVEIAHRLRADPAERGDGVFFCDCAEARTADQVADALGRALVSPPPIAEDVDAAHEVGRALAGRGRVLIVLDNLEQVVEPAASVVATWLGLAPEARFLTTSRARLRLAEELAIEIEPLGLPPAPGAGDGDLDALRASEAVQLFLARAARTPRRGPPLDDSPDELRAVAALTRRLDGLPLAIELCAGRAATFSPRRLLAELERGFDRVAAAEPGRPARQATLRSTIEWSWALLRPTEQRALARLSVFRGGFDLAAASSLFAAAGDATEAPAVIAGLHEHSLLRAEPDARLDGEIRYTLLEAVRAFAAERLDAFGSGARANAERAHAEHFAALGDALCRADDEGRDPLAAVRARREFDNLLAAHERAFDAAPALAASALAGLAPILATALRFELASGLADRAVLAAARAGAPAPHARALRLRGEVRRRFALAAAEEDFRAALALEHDPHDPAAQRHQAQARAGLGVVLRDQGRFADAAEQLRRALTAAAGAPRDEAAILLALAALRRREGESDEAIGHAERALAIARRGADELLEGRALLTLGLLDDDRARLEPALARVEAAIERLRAAGDRWNEESALNAAGLLHDELGRPAEARACFDEALSICAELGFRAGTACVLGNLGWVEEAAGDRARSVERFHQSTTLARDVGHAILEAQFTASLGAVEALRGRLPASREAFAAAERCAEGCPSPALHADIATLRGLLDVAEAESARAQGDRPRAERHEALARARLASALALTPEHGSGDVRLAIRRLARALDAAEPPARPTTTLRLRDAAASFQLGDSEPVDLARQGVLRRVLAALVEARIDAPGVPRDVAALFASAWPGERIGARSMRNRVHVALTALRKAGLADAIESHADGYRIASWVRVERD